jgi:hypothetical protein
MLYTIFNRMKKLNKTFIHHYLRLIVNPTAPLPNGHDQPYCYPKIARYNQYMSDCKGLFTCPHLELTNAVIKATSI